MNIWQAILMGLIQGLTEFLPVSSSGHLLLGRLIMGIETPPMVFEVIVHCGTLVAVLFVLRQDILRILKNPLGKLMRYLVIATVPAVIVTLLFSGFIETAFAGNGYLLAGGFLCTGVILSLSEYFSARQSKQKKFEQMDALDALTMGGMQAVALIPGISRSGSTIAGGIMRGLNRKLAARFAFLMSVPAILGSLVFELKDLIEFGASGVGVLPLIVGFVVAAISGFFAIRFMLNLISNQKLYGFAIYVAILGIFVLCDTLFIHWLF
ncbi:undecaprenyl-diphosphate phosphatase [Eubacteriales bacterium OttesenSCG-928-N14]|nr:undecaprenyl-diphosphate phosphatase [Eubacteriales bacterium OttesenSCG-928-N14]